MRVIPPAAETAARGALTVAPDRRRRLSQGVLVEASILARLLGLRLLTLEATMVLVPAEVTTRSPAQRPATSRASGPAPRNGGSAGGARRGLADAVRSLDEGAKLLQEAGTAGRRRRPRP